MQPEQSGIKTWQWVVTIIVIIAIIIVGIFVFNKDTTTPVVTDETPEAIPSETSANSIVMSDQFPGNVVYVSSIQAASDGWVAIHKDNAGKPGDVIGSAKVSAGLNPVKITLSKPTIDGQIYYAILYTDDGDGKFDVKKDATVKDSRDNVVMRIFRASASVSSEIKG